MSVVRICAFLRARGSMVLSASRDPKLALRRQDRGSLKQRRVAHSESAVALFTLSLSLARSLSLSLSLFLLCIYKFSRLSV